MTATQTAMTPSRAPGAEEQLVDERILLRRYAQEPSETVREELVERFMPLARKLARRYSGGAEPLEDLMQVASLGLVKAIDRFDPSRGAAFSTFAVPTILGELKRHFRDRGWSVRVPRGTQELTLKVEKSIAELPARLGRTPTVNDIARWLEVEDEQVLEAMHASQGHHAASLDRPTSLSGEDSTTLLDQIGGEDPALRRGRVRGRDRGRPGGELRPRAHDPPPPLRGGHDPEPDRREGGRVPDARLASAPSDAGPPARRGRG